MAEYVIHLRVVTDREPRDVTNWDAMTTAAGLMFKARPTGRRIEVVSILMEQVDPATKQTDVDQMRLYEPEVEG